MELIITPFVRYAARSSYIIAKKYIIASDCRLLYILSGSGCFESKDMRCELAPGALVCYPYGLAYKLTSDPKNAMVFYTINFDFTNDFSNITDVIPPKPEREFNPESQLVSLKNELYDIFSKVIYKENAIWAKSHLEAIYSETVYRRTGYRQIQSAHMQILLLHLYRALSKTTQNNLYVQMKILIDENLHLNNKMIARKLNYHPYYLNEIFKKNEGISLYQYVLGQRLAKAYELVTATLLTCDEIAHICGFCSQAHFSHAFKKQYGITPTNLRHQL